MPDVKEQVNRVGLALAEQGLAFDHVDDFENPMIVMGFGGGEFSFTNIMIHVVFDLDGTSVQVVSSPIANVPPEKTQEVLRTLNSCNQHFRWVTFYLDEENDIIADSDVLFDEQNIGEAVIEMVLKTASIIDDAYKDIMKAVWN